MEKQSKYPFAYESPVRVCFAGFPSGSWEIRGKQIAACRTNWTERRDYERLDLDAYDVFCFVKFPLPSLIRALHRRGKIVVLDVLDSWLQPEEGLLCANVGDARKLYEKKWSRNRFHAYIFPNLTMMADLGSLTPQRSFIYHHYRPGLAPIEVRECVKRVGYEGNPSFLGPYYEILNRMCAERGLEFVVNPSDYRSLDIGIACRGGIHESFMSSRYKSNVKLANFYGAGLPCLVSHKEFSYQETDNGSVLFFDSERALAEQLDRLLSFSFRKQIHASFLETRKHFSIEHISSLYEAFFTNLRTSRQAETRPGLEFDWRLADE